MRTPKELKHDSDALLIEIGDILWKVKDIEFRLSNIVEREQKKRQTELVELFQEVNNRELSKKILEEKGTPLFCLNLTVRTEHSLAAMGINTIEQLTKKTQADILKLPNIGKKALNEIVQALSNLNLKLKGN